ncbi:unnamed protein product [Lactuca virosa]|uniref:Uncharacterized protein n=1 Tax=Lactuca virosa TaxID=75947 RepID=A0AAU9N879_9ASTR|nr:unnamed protein product [Lactuca virosa]
MFVQHTEAMLDDIETMVLEPYFMFAFNLLVLLLWTLTLLIEYIDEIFTHYQNKSCFKGHRGREKPATKLDYAGINTKKQK